jgi:hypothetical protein
MMCGLELVKDLDKYYLQRMVYWFVVFGVEEVAPTLHSASLFLQQSVRPPHTSLFVQ